MTIKAKIKKAKIKMSREITVSDDHEDEDERDIRQADFDDFKDNINFTNSDCPITFAVSQIRKPGNDYLAANAMPQRINELLSKGWDLEDNSHIRNRRTYNINERNKDLIEVVDTLIMSRASHYREREKAAKEIESTNKLASAYSRFKKYGGNENMGDQARITNITNPFVK